jgi:hypothetical protein
MRKNGEEFIFAPVSALEQNKKKINLAKQTCEKL